jgi:hypothetical protein
VPVSVLTWPLAWDWGTYHGDRPDQDARRRRVVRHNVRDEVGGHPDYGDQRAFLEQAGEVEGCAEGSVRGEHVVFCVDLGFWVG